MGLMKKKVEIKSKKVPGGIYLVLDPALETSILMDRLKRSLENGIDLLQIWNHWPEEFSEYDKITLADEIAELAGNYSVPVLINDDWKLLNSTRLDGVHFDEIPPDFEKVRSQLDENTLVGITCSNNLDVVKWAIEQGADYISFCAMFPSASAGACEIVKPETVQKAREVCSLPIFVSGGITPKNLGELLPLGIDGIAVISGILSSDSPGKAISEYKKILQKK